MRIYFYQNAEPTASVLIENDKGEILLTQRAIEPLKGYWDTAGGFREEETSIRRLPFRREIKEELGVEVELTGLIGIIMDRYGDDGDATINMYYSGRIKKRGNKIQPTILTLINGFLWIVCQKWLLKAGRHALDTLKKIAPKTLINWGKRGKAGNFGYR